MLDALFLGVIEATEEAVYSTLLRAETMEEHARHVRETLPMDTLVKTAPPIWQDSVNGA